MITVLPEPEPAGFHIQVRVPGQAFLGLIPHPSNRQYKQNRSEYWRSCLGHLYSDYGEICAYMAEWILRTDASVDHFIPKSSNPNLAYEWSNYRLSLKQLNSNKGSKTIIDPFNMTNGWFVIDFDTFFIQPKARLNNTVKSLVRYTIRELKLNDDMFRNRRIRYIDSYCKGLATYQSLARRAPFIARELKRQRLSKKTICEKFKAFLARTNPESPSPP